MGKYDKDIRRWRSIIGDNKRRAIALFKRRHRHEELEPAEVRSEISFLRAQSRRLTKFIRDYRRRDLSA